MAIIGAHIIRDLPEEYKIYSEKDFTFNKIKQPNRNGLLWDKTINVDGMKPDTQAKQVITLSHQQQVQTICV